MNSSVREQASDSWNDVAERYESDMQDRYLDMILSFASMVRGEKVNPYTPDYELALYRLVMRACGC